MEIFLFLIFAILFGVIAYLGYLQQQKRRKALAQLAAELGWSFDPRRDRSHDDRFRQFDSFRKGHSRFAYNTLRGELVVDGRRWPVTMGDYHYQITSGSGKNRHTHTYRFSYAILELPFAGLCDLVIRREGMFDKLAGWVGFDDIDFESAEFSDRFHVKSSNKKFAYDVVDPRMMQFLLASDPPSIDVDGHHCCLSDGNRCWEPEKFRAMLDWAQMFFDHWPDHVTATLEGDTQRYGP